METNDETFFFSWVRKFIFKYPKHTLLRIFQRNIIKYAKKVNNSSRIPRSRYESEAIKICRNIVQNPETTLEMNTNGERYATNEKIDLIYFIYETSVDVIKNKISREIVISPKAHETIINIFDGHVRMRRDAKKEIVLMSLKSTLESIVVESKKALDDANASKK